MSERPRTTCPACGGVIESDEAAVVETVEIVPVPGFGAHEDVEDGMRVVFHESCFADGYPGYRRR